MMAPGAPPRTRRRRSTEVPGTVTNQPGGREAALAAGARLIARGGVLDDQLDGLAAGACAMTGATSAVVYLFDGDNGVLVAAGSAGLGEHAMPPSEPLTVGSGADGAPAARAVRGRHSEIVAITADMTSALAGRSGGILAMGIVPLVTEDATGSQEVQGLLVAGLPTMPDDPAATLADLDGLAAISAGLGADVGDDILRRVAATLADSVRLVDTVARYGGDEFVVLAPGSAGRAVAQRVVDAVAHLDLANGAGSITLSAGVVRFPDDGANAEELLIAAGEALSAAKATAPAAPVPPRPAGPAGWCGRGPAHPWTRRPRPAAPRGPCRCRGPGRQGSSPRSGRTRRPHPGRAPVARPRPRAAPGPR